MTRNILTILLAFGLLAAAASTATAQNRLPKAGSARAGAGVSLSGEALTLNSALIGSNAIGFGNVHIPILIGTQFRVEPTLGFARITNSPDPDTRTTNQIFNLALGAYFSFQPAKSSPVVVYVGPRFGFLANSSESTANSQTTEASRTDFYGGLAFGGEYFFAKTFSLGGEIRATYIVIGDTEITAPGASSTTASTDESFVVDNRFVVRWYFL